MQLNSGASLQSEINVTPLVDVVLVLLIIFMVVVPLLLQGYDVGMPKDSAAGAPVNPATETQLVLTIAAENCPLLAQTSGDTVPAGCQVNLDGANIPAAELPGRVAQALSGRPADQHILFLAADDRLNYEGVLRIVDLARSGSDDLRIEFLTTN
jgi:biopolymer transport protein ExbD